MKLGNYRELRNANELDAIRLRMAWDLRCQRNAAASAEQEPSEAGISEERWNQISDPVKRLATRRANAFQRQNGNFFITNEPARPEEPGVTLLASGDKRVLLNRPEEDFSANIRLQVNVAAAQQMQFQIQQTNQQLQRAQKRLAENPNMAEAQRQVILDQIAIIQQRLTILKAQRRQLMGMEP
jgi:hypothetical protein